MLLARQRQWRTQNQYQSLNEYNILKHTSPPGIYLSLTPGNFSLWSGVIFVRSGPYAPSILRFQVALPQQYPAVPPLIVFTTDVFHPLITPLTTYTYSTSTPASTTISSGDDERLLPGGLSLRHGFPQWYESARAGSPRLSEPMFKDINLSRTETEHDNSKPTQAPRLGHRRPLSFHIPPPKEDDVDENDIQPSISEVLYYLKRVFEDETLLDDLPLDVAANTGAWYAWRAHRRKTSKPLPKLPGDNASRPSPSPSHGRSKSLQMSSPITPTSSALTATPALNEQPQKKKTMADWNWDGVWLERVKKGINASLSDAVLYGNAEGDDLIHFLDVEDDEFSSFWDSLPSPEPSRQASVDMLSMEELKIRKI